MSSVDDVLQLISDAASTKSTILDLSGRQLDVVPAELWTLKHLVSLDLSGNILEKIPEEMSNLRNLETLKLRGNRLTELPRVVCQLTQLKTLDLFKNKLCNLPAEIESLTSLENLDLRYNILTSLPRQIGKLTSLLRIQLRVNMLEEIPAEIGEMSSLVYLDLRVNRISKLPPTIGKLSNLEILDLRGNDLRELPREIGNLYKLQSLDLNYNQLEALVPELGQLSNLRSFDIEDNQISALPQELANLHPSVRINASGNPLPKAILQLAERSGALLTYLRSVSHSNECRSYSEREAKLLVVGDPNVGKTSLVASILKERFVPNRPTTHGISVRHIDFERSDGNADRITLHTWDFGGQDAYRITHQLFYSDQCLYLLVWNPRDSKPESVREWIKQIVSRTSNDVRILVVATHRDKCGVYPDLNYGSLQKEFGDLLAGFFSVDSESGAGINELRDAITFHSFSLQPTVPLTWNEHWAEARDRLLSLSSPVLTLHEVSERFESYGLCPSETLALLSLLHSIGLVIWFQDDEGLRDFVVLQPEWITGAIAAVLMDATTRERLGILEHSRLRSLWSEDLVRGRQGYPVESHPYFLRLMEKFDLSYRLPDGTCSLVGQLVPHQRPDNVWHAHSDTTCAEHELRLNCRLSIVPVGVMAWMTVRNHRFTSGLHWRSGVLLTHLSHEALVELNENCIEITVRGPFPSHLMSLLRDSLGFLLRERWPGVTYEWLVPCPTKDESANGCKGTFKLSFLESAVGKWHELPCQECAKEQNLSSLLVGHTLHRRMVNSQLPELESKLKGIERNISNLRDCSAYGALQVRRLLNALGTETKDCPFLFSLSQNPLSAWNPLKVATEQFQLTLWCQHPEGQHEFLDASYRITQAKDWLAKMAPYAWLVTRTLQIVGGADLTFMEDRVGKILSDEMRAMGTDGLSSLALTAEEGAAARELRAILLKLDPSGRWGGLRRVLSASGDYLWVCPEHYPLYDPGIPTIDI